MSRAKKFQKLANKLISKFDERTGSNQMTFTHKSTNLADRIYNPATGQYEYTSKTYTCKVVSTNASSDMINGQSVIVGDMFVKISPFMKDVLDNTVTVEPSVGDEVKLNGGAWDVVMCDPIMYAGEQTPVLYTVQVRK